MTKCRRVLGMMNESDGEFPISHYTINGITVFGSEVANPLLMDLISTISKEILEKAESDNVQLLTSNCGIYAKGDKLFVGYRIRR